MGTIKIGSSANRKGITINPSSVLFDGNNVKKIMSGENIIWKELIPLIPTMTSNTAPYGEASASSSHSSNPAYYLFDGNDTTTWRVANSSTPGSSNEAYVQYKFVSPVVVKSLMMKHVSITITTKIEVLGSNNGSDFTTIKTFTYDTTELDPITRELDFSDNNNEYMYIRVKLKQTNKHTSNSYVPQLYTLQLYR